MIRLTIPSIEQDDLDVVCEVLRSGFLVQGPRVAQFEAAVAGYTGAEQAVAVSSGTAALHLALLSLGVGPGDRVAVSAYSWPATANVIVLCGAEPVFVDVDPATYNMDIEALRRTVGNTRIKAILPVHTFGGMADMRAITLLSSQSGIPVVEDAACALGAALEHRLAGTWGTLTCFSFHPRKAITTGEGGMVTTNDAGVAEKVRMLRNHGLDPSSSHPDFIAAGFNLRMTEFQAALGTSQLRKLERIIAHRRAAATRYDRLLADSAIGPPQALPGSRHIYQSYTALLPREASAKRGDIIQQMRSAGIEVTIGTYHIPLTTYFRSRGNFRPGDFPATDDIASRTVSLPMHEYIRESAQQEVIAALRELTG